MPRLVCRTGPNQGAVYELAGDRVTVGRGVEATIQIPSEIISRTHAAFLRDASGWRVRDEGSRNGTFVNGQRVAETRLKAGDEVLIGESSFVYVVEDATDAEAPVMDDLAGELAVSEALDAGDLARRARARLAKAVAKDDTQGRRLLSLLDFSRAAGAATTYPEIFSALTTMIENDLKPHRVVPILFDAEKGALMPWMKAASGFARALSRVPISRTIVNYVRDRRVAVLSEEASRDDRFRGARSIHEQRIATAMCAPMLAGGELIGMIYADRLGDAARFQSEDLEALNAFASQAASAVASVRSMDHMRRERQVRDKELRGKYDIAGCSPAIEKVFSFIAKAAPASSSVLILGESGTGKELVARAIHASSPRRYQAFEAVNCAALAPSLLESELFGHVKGAFTGADADRAGRFELADGGVLFLDEIGELPESSQSKLLRALEQGEVRRLGGVKDVKVDVRLIAATNKKLEDEMRAGRFREDLYFRLNVLAVELPPLRERREDIPLLAERFLREFVASCGRPALRFSEATLKALEQHDWPGNVRELRNVVERMVVMAEGPTLEPADIPYASRAGARPAPSSGEAWQPRSLREMERDHIARVLEHTGGNKKETARILEIDRSTLYAKLKLYGLGE
ncbi:MAG TPA: sigma 54-interacting transcriptional regulator [Candidatus Brocadiia bacterium]|nr:sigma 54-interacting transcriptional regulator [Candidatus Brocadiia bacterium]